MSKNSSRVALNFDEITRKKSGKQTPEKLLTPGERAKTLPPSSDENSSAKFSPGETYRKRIDLKEILMMGPEPKKAKKSAQLSEEETQEQESSDIEPVEMIVVEENPLEEILKGHNAIVEQKKIISVTDLEEGTAYQVLAVRAIKTRSLTYTIIFELDEGNLYLPYKYKTYWNDVFCINEAGEPTGKTPKIHIIDNTFYHPSLFFTIKKTKKSNAT